MKDMPIPFIDEHSLVIDAPIDDVWRVLIRKLAGWNTPAAAAYAWATGASPRRSTGRFPDPGSTLPGFSIRDAEAPHRLVLVGSHHFSRYKLAFLLEKADERTLIRARSHAAFPGLLGLGYRTVVIGSGAHRAVTRQLLRSVQRDCVASSRTVASWRTSLRRFR